MKLKTKLMLLGMLLLNISLFAQDSFIVSGTVITGVDNEPIPGVNVIIVNSTQGVTTDFDGNYSLEVKNGDVLQFSYIGFTSQTVIVNGQRTINVTLQEDANQLDEVVVIGYGTSKKSHLTGSISKVVNEELDQIPVARVDDALVGQVSGVNIQQTSGEAGSAPTIRIRGTGSITGDSGPLVVVDGAVVDSDFLGSMDMNDVESFEVLKDAASASIFGSRGGNGVIMITTKRGKEGRTKFSFNTYGGYKSARQSDSYYFSVAETAERELAETGSLSDKTRYMQLIGTDRDWQDVIFDGGFITNYALSVRGGSEKTKFSTSFSYLHDEGVLLTDDFKKYNLNLRVDTKLSDKFSTGVSLTPSYTNTRRFDGSTHDILRQPPWLPLYLDEYNIQFVNRTREGGAYADAKIGDYAVQRMFDDYDLENGMPSTGSGTDISDTSNTNPAAKVLERERRDFKFKLYGSAYGQWNITDDLNFRTNFAGDFQNTKRTRWQGVLASRNGAAAAQSDFIQHNTIHLVWDNFLSYNKEFGKSEISAIAGISAEGWKNDYSSMTGTGYDSDLVQSINNATLISSATQFEYEKRLLSYVGRVNYAYDNRYLASFSIRRDGSSIFGSNYKYGNFPAASVGWNVSNEAFLENSKAISNLKFRFSWGVTGNDRLNTGNVNPNVSDGNNTISTGDAMIDNYPYLPLLDASTAVINGALAGGFNPINIANPDLQWERSVEINPGIDFGFYNNVVSGSVDYYKRTSDQLLLNNPISATTGFTEALVNLGEVQNEGFEVELRVRWITKENFSWNTAFIASHNENTLTDFAASNGQIQNVDTKRAAEWINLEGNPISSFYGWVVDRDIPTEYIRDPYHPIGAEPQDVYVKDLNGDGLIDDDDKAIIGNPYPDFIWSITNNFTIGSFDISFMFQGSHGAEIRNMGDQYLFNHFGSSQDFDPNTTPDQGFIKEKIFTNDIVQDASYIALRNVNIGFNFPKDWTSRGNVFTNARIYAAGQNLMYLTADDYTGFNPESIDNTSPTAYGYQRAGSPIFRTISIGLNLDF
ncbi:SusC/RagA family TonB-linked outer membrane protein [Namhaeicola litoreus]|uniref:SusC/RagA family TonB-linked outer membrane protein n=1 Tax=Namhaeicola litoreus TaxID=1052145 RepID=A0ABW3Y3H9_9FLAO